MLEKPTKALHHIERRSFIGGFDLRVIMGDGEAAPLRRRPEKRGEVEPKTRPAT